MTLEEEPGLQRGCLAKAFRTSALAGAVGIGATDQWYNPARGRRREPCRA
jgi:hypothetical protein